MIHSVLVGFVILLMTPRENHQAWTLQSFKRMRQLIQLTNMPMQSLPRPFALVQPRSQPETWCNIANLQWQDFSLCRCGDRVFSFRQQMSLAGEHFADRMHPRGKSIL
mmetsp:Transcript_53250/g.79535  ORF Transcript_53250/g.79535 Transcript_53250/m.79535 type:complete len:108 (-) Transcript_53250:86-409(-)